MKLLDILDHDTPSFLALCQSHFETRSTLKYIFADDGTHIANLSIFFSKQTTTELFVSTYPYFIG
jgi:hypothetical protein